MVWGEPSPSELVSFCRLKPGPVWQGYKDVPSLGPCLSLCWASADTRRQRRVAALVRTQATSRELLMASRFLRSQWSLAEVQS